MSDDEQPMPLRLYVSTSRRSLKWFTIMAAMDGVGAKHEHDTMTMSISCGSTPDVRSRFSTTSKMTISVSSIASLSDVLRSLPRAMPRMPVTGGSRGLWARGSERARWGQFARARAVRERARWELGRARTHNTLRARAVGQAGLVAEARALHDLLLEVEVLLGEAAAVAHLLHERAARHAEAVCRVPMFMGAGEQAGVSRSVGWSCVERDGGGAGGRVRAGNFMQQVAAVAAGGTRGGHMRRHSGTRTLAAHRSGGRKHAKSSR